MIKIHGPMWQWECDHCLMMGDCYDSLDEAFANSINHKCAPTFAEAQAKLDDMSARYEAVMSTLNVDFEDMFPDWDDKEEE